MYIMVKFLSDFVIGYKLKKKLKSLAFVSKENLNQFKTFQNLSNPVFSVGGFQMSILLK